MSWFESLTPVMQAIIATTFTWAVTALGALIVCFFKEMNGKILDTILGFSAGVMIAASFWSLIAPAIDLSTELGYIAWLLPALGFVLGGMFVLISDGFLDKMLKIKNNVKRTISLKRSILLISAITIHNIPEGMAVGVAFGGIASGVPRNDNNRSYYASNWNRYTKLSRGGSCCIAIKKRGILKI